MWVLFFYYRYFGFEMEFHQMIFYFKYFSFFIMGVVIGRLSMAIQYAIMKPKAK